LKTAIEWRPAPPSLVLGPLDVHVWRAPGAIDGPTARALANDLSTDERERAEQFAFAPDRTRFVAARGTMRAVLARYLARPPRALSFRYGPEGRPELAGPDEARLRFNLSHSGGVVVLAVTKAADVGIDLERVRADASLEDLGTALASEERAWLEGLREEERVRAFFTVWTCKEAYVKALGRGLSVVDACAVRIGEGGEARLARAASEDPGPRDWNFSVFDPTPDGAASRYCAAVIARTRHPSFAYYDAVDSTSWRDA
jgi:4'-phosphopantetheinyl transferase